MLLLLQKELAKVLSGLLPPSPSSWELWKPWKIKMNKQVEFWTIWAWPRCAAVRRSPGCGAGSPWGADTWGWWLQMPRAGSALSWSPTVAPQNQPWSPGLGARQPSPVPQCDVRGSWGHICSKLLLQRRYEGFPLPLCCRSKSEAFCACSKGFVNPF